MLSAMDPDDLVIPLPYAAFLGCCSASIGCQFHAASGLGRPSRDERNNDEDNAYDDQRMNCRKGYFQRKPQNQPDNDQ
jgi:hypothetical protein